MLSAGVRPTYKVGRNQGRRAPVEYRDAVEAWARGHGGHGDIVWVPAPANVWQVRLSLKAGDPRLQFGEGFETVELHDWWSAEQWLKNKPDLAKRRAASRVARPGKRSHRITPGYYAFELDELGIEGILSRLSRGNLLSGRGEFKSAEEAGDIQRQKHRAAKEKRRLDEREDARHRSLDIRRSLLKIPFLPVGIEFTKGTTTSTTSAKD